MQYIVQRGIDNWGEDGFAANREAIVTGFVDLALHEMQVPEQTLRNLEAEFLAATDYQMLAEVLRPYFLSLLEVNERMSYDLSLRQVPDLGQVMEGMWRNLEYFS